MRTYMHDDALSPALVAPAAGLGPPLAFVDAPAKPCQGADVDLGRLTLVRTIVFSCFVISFSSSFAAAAPTEEAAESPLAAARAAAGVENRDSNCERLTNRSLRKRRRLIT